MSDRPAKPWPKSQQLARGPRRYRRKVASAKTWQMICDEKIGPCRVCGKPHDNGRVFGKIQFHHIVPRDAPYFGDDVPENIAPVGTGDEDCHDKVTRRDPEACLALCSSLTDAEYAYAVEKMGEAVFARVYGITYER